MKVVWWRPAVTRTCLPKAASTRGYARRAFGSNDRLQDRPHSNRPAPATLDGSSERMPPRRGCGSARFGCASALHACASGLFARASALHGFGGVIFHRAGARCPPRRCPNASAGAEFGPVRAPFRPSDTHLRPAGVGPTSWSELPGRNSCGISGAVRTIGALPFAITPNRTPPRGNQSTWVGPSNGRRSRSKRGAAGVGPASPRRGW